MTQYHYVISVVLEVDAEWAARPPDYVGNWVHGRLASSHTTPQSVVVGAVVKASNEAGDPSDAAKTDPSLEEIRQHTAEIQAAWPERKRRSREGTIRTIHLADITAAAIDDAATRESEK